MKDISSKTEKEKAVSSVKDQELTLGEVIQQTAQKWAPAFRIMILVCIFIVAFFVRIFSVIFLFF